MAKVNYRVDDRGVAYVTINRPEVLNALDSEAQKALQQVWLDVENDRSVRVVVLTGAGDRSFCVGSDMKDIGDSGVLYWGRAGHYDGYGGLTVRQTLTVPVIARVNGYAVGGGMELMLGADLIIAADNAQFGLVEARVGRVPLDGGIQRLLRTIPRLHAMDLIVTGRKIGATEALSMQLVNSVVPFAELDDAVEAKVAEVLACAPLSVKASKAIALRATSVAEDRDLAGLRIREVIDALESPDADEGVAAFLEKRPPHWSGT